VRDEGSVGLPGEAGGGEGEGEEETGRNGKETGTREVHNA